MEGDLAYPPKKHNLRKCSLQLHHEADLGKASMLEVSIISLWAVQVVDFRFGWVPGMIFLYFFAGREFSQ